MTFAGHTPGSGWRRTTRDLPCPICGRTKWCGVSSDGSAAICMVTESEKPTANGGWLHVFRDAGDRLPHSPPRRVRVRAQALPHDLTHVAVAHQQALHDDHLTRIALQLGVSMESLSRLGCGWNGRAASFPMVDAHLKVIGIRYRSMAGSQWAEKGGREGLFVPRDLPATGPLLLPEGPTDTAALLSITDFAIVGRPNCCGGVKPCVELARGRDAVICADADEPGQCGAAALAGALLVVARTVRVISPPRGHKDFRDAVRAGLNDTEVRTLIDAASPLQLAVRVRS